MDELITAESLAANPEWVERGLEIGDPIPKKPTASEKSATVLVDREMLEGILKEVGEMRGKLSRMDQLEKDNKMLVEVADKGRLNNWQARNNPQGLVRTARVWLYDGKIVKATVTTKNEVFTDVNGRVYTDQMINVIFEDTSEKEMPYDKFAKEKELVEADIVKRSTDDQNGQTFYTMKMKDGKTIDINYLFLN